MAVRLGSAGEAGDVVGLLDIGNGKTACSIVALTGPGRGLAGMRVLGVGVEPSRGMKGGLVVELGEAEQAVRGAVAQAEKAAGVAVEEVFLSVACGRLRSSTFTAHTEIEGHVVGTGDIERLMAAARAHAEREGRAVLHLGCLSYRLDGAAGVADPLGMAGRSLGADLHAVTADEAPLRNLLHVVERAYLTAAGFAAAPHAGGLAATTDEERRQGVVCLDLGAGTTMISAFAGGHLLWNEVVPVGGNHATFDLAQELGAPAHEAERLKKEFASLARGADDGREAVAYAVYGAAGGPGARGRTTTGEIAAIVRGRMLRLFGHIAGRIDRSGVASYAMRRIVLCGGGSRLAGLGEFAADFFARPVRVARIEPLEGMPPAFAGPEYATLLGLAHVAADPAAGAWWMSSARQSGSYLKRMGQWLREGF